jgi:uncharacterized protein (TIGR03435 family)
MKKISVVVTAVIAVLAYSAAPRAQTPAPAPVAADLVFEVATVKQSNPDPSNPLSMIPMAMPQPGGRFTATNLPLKMLIRLAYEVQDFQIIGGPSALLASKFDITAKAAGGATLGQKELLPMIKALLIDRFKLKTHLEPREMPVYDLVIARSDGRLGPDLKRSTSDCSNQAELDAKRAEAVSKGDLSSVMPKPGEVLRCTIAPNIAGGPANLGLHADGQELKILTELLTQMTGRTVRDKTGLTGRFDFDMKLDLQLMLAMASQAGVNVPAAAAANLPQSDGSSLMTTLQEQLGLKLESGRGPVNVVVVDSVEMPAAD